MLLLTEDVMTKLRILQTEKNKIFNEKNVFYFHEKLEISNTVEFIVNQKF